MRYEEITEAKFIERENRFVAKAALPDGEICRVHVKNTGRCRELLVPGNTVYLEDFHGRMGNRKMRYSLVAVKKDVTLLINMDSQAPNKAVHEALADGTIRLPQMEEISIIKPETVFGNSRFDFYVATDADPNAGQGACRRGAYIEVKGVTLEENGHARFPDAPTERGVKHINELIRAHEEGFGAYIIFLAQIEGTKDISPNYGTHREFGEALARASESGVKVLAYDCLVAPDRLQVNKQIRFKF